MSVLQANAALLDDGVTSDLYCGNLSQIPSQQKINAAHVIAQFEAGEAVDKEDPTLLTPERRRRLRQAALVWMATVFRSPLPAVRGERRGPAVKYRQVLHITLALFIGQRTGVVTELRHSKFVSAHYSSISATWTLSRLGGKTAKAGGAMTLVLLQEEWQALQFLVQRLGPLLSSERGDTPLFAGLRPYEMLQHDDAFPGDIPYANGIRGTCRDARPDVLRRPAGGGRRAGGHDSRRAGLLPTAPRKRGPPYVRREAGVRPGRKSAGRLPVVDGNFGRRRNGAGTASGFTARGPHPAAGGRGAGGVAPAGGRGGRGGGVPCRPRAGLRRRQAVAARPAGGGRPHSHR